MFLGIGSGVLSSQMLQHPALLTSFPLGLCFLSLMGRCSEVEAQTRWCSSAVRSRLPPACGCNLLASAVGSGVAFLHTGPNLWLSLRVCESAGRATTVLQVFWVGLQRCSESQGYSLLESCSSFNRLWNFGIKLFKSSDNTTHLQVPYSTINIHCTAFSLYNVD